MMRGCASRNAARAVGKHLAADHLAGSDAHDAAVVLCLAGSGTLQRVRGAGHGLRMRDQEACAVTGDQTSLRTREERNPERRLERVDVATHRRLGEAERAGRPGQAALTHHGQKRAVKAPNRAVSYSYKYV